MGIAAVEGALKQGNVKPEMIEDLYFGNVLQAGVGQSPARQVVLGAGMPDSTEATTINKVRRRLRDEHPIAYTKTGLRQWNEGRHARRSEYPDRPA